jgi:RimJ/RimL family protein N-acetyltransferase
MANHTAPLRDPRIETARLVLRPPTETDLDDIVAGINDLAVVRMLARVPFPYARADAENFLAWSLTSQNDINLVVDRDGAAIGCIGLNDIKAACEFGYWLGKAHWRHGFATEAGRAFLGYCFDTVDVGTIRAGAFADNPASLRVQEKLGFQRTGSSLRTSLARGGKVEHIDTALTRNRFYEATQ